MDNPAAELISPKRDRLSYYPPVPMQHPRSGHAPAKPPVTFREIRNLAGARGWATAFVRWYNHEHRHSGIRYVSPAQRHAGDDGAILAARHAVYLRAREQNPARWSGSTRNWSPVGAVTLNPERDSVIKASLANHQHQPLVA